MAYKPKLPPFSAVSAPSASPFIPAKVVTSVTSVTEGDPYGERMRAALAQINRPDYPAGMIPWLGEAHPGLYDELTSRIPDEIDLAWKCQVPLAQFAIILARLVQTHRQARDLYRAAHPHGGKLGAKQQ